MSFHIFVSKVYAKLCHIYNVRKLRIHTWLIAPRFKTFGLNSYIPSDAITHGENNISIGHNVLFGKRLTLRTFDSWLSNKYNPILEIKDNVNILNDCHISAINGITINENALLASHITIIDHNHGFSTFDEHPLNADLTSDGTIEIGKNCWIGEFCVILGGAHIGEGCIVGANSVVVKGEYPPHSVLIGSPARVIKTNNKKPI